MSGLTIEDAVGVAAFVQELHNAAQGGSPVDEETLALRMLAAAHADADFDPSHIKSPFSDAGSATTMSASGGRDRFDDFADMMMGDLKTPQEQVNEGKVPKPPPVVVEDPVGDNVQGYDKSEALKNFALLKDAHSVCQMFTNIMLMKTNPDGFDITKEAAEAFNVQAKLAYNAMSGPMAGVYNFGQGVHTKHNFTIPKSQIHEKLLETMFDSMRMDDSHKKEIDSQITNFVKALKDITVDADKHSTLDFALRFGLTPAVNITGDAANPMWAFEPTTFLVYLTMDAKAFTKSISKHNTEDRINLIYEHVVTKFDLNVNGFLKQRPKYDAMFEKATGINLKKYGDMLNKSVKKK
ncbi:hypothetical protein QBC40DRAFT_331503 [Triangularia verruculosa]|uniref:Uncharacterized protein n=1 Tax=Triangularia verruculosa TaxID=2587418 RepID=A0AAN6XD19_9PEZI|nr:hypothetical protein QBC40DRAFT_331503 [Triangularia verruculosa]